MKKVRIAMFLAVITALLVSTGALAAFTNGNFEAGDFSGWTGPLNSPISPETIFLNNQLTLPEPFGWNSIVRDTGGTNLSAIVTAGTDPNTNNAINMVHNGTYSARINSQDSYSGGGWPYNANAIRQTFTVGAGDVQPNGDIHMMFAYAPVLVDPGHAPQEQPYFFVGVKNLTTGQTLYEEFSIVNQAGYPWMPGATTAAGSWFYMDWQEVDLVSTAANPKMSVGDSIEIEVIGSACGQGGHPGYIYVDDFAFAIPAGCSPTLATINPTSGPIAGGTPVTITGTNLDTVTALYFGTTSILPAQFTSQSATQIVVNSPAGSAGPVTITVVNPCGSASFFNGFQYVDNTAPVAVDDSYGTNMSVAFNGATVLVNDTDGDSDPLTAALVTGPANASDFTFNADGTFYYEPANGFQGTDTFTYMANDGTADSNVATVSIDVTPLVMTFYSLNTLDGWVSEFAQNSGTGGNLIANGILRLGDTALNQQYRSFLSFDASAMPANAEIVDARVRIKYFDIRGVDPTTTHGYLVADVKTGVFGSSQALAAEDFNASASKMRLGIFRQSPNNPIWWNMLIRPADYHYVNQGGITQFRLRFELRTNGDSIEDWIRFASGNNVTATQPRMIVAYYIPHP